MLRQRPRPQGEPQRSGGGGQAAGTLPRTALVQKAAQQVFTPSPRDDQWQALTDRRLELLRLVSLCSPSYRDVRINTHKCIHHMRSEKYKHTKKCSSILVLANDFFLYLCFIAINDVGFKVIFASMP